MKTSYLTIKPCTNAEMFATITDYLSCGYKLIQMGDIVIVRKEIGALAEEVTITLRGRG